MSIPYIQFLRMPLNVLVIFATRTWAIWERSRRMLWFLVVLAIVQQQLFTLIMSQLTRVV